MATLSTQVPSLAGLAPSYASAAAGGDKVECGERNFIHVKNGGGSPTTVTLTTVASVRGIATGNVTVSVPAAGERMIGPIQPDLFQNQTDGLCAVGYSASASVTVAALRI